METFRDEGKFAQLDDRQAIAWLEGIFFFSLTWSIGASGNEVGRAKFDLLVKELQEVKKILVLHEIFHHTLGAAHWPFILSPALLFNWLMEICQFVVECIKYNVFVAC